MSGLNLAFLDTFFSKKWVTAGRDGIPTIEPMKETMRCARFKLQFVVELLYLYARTMLLQRTLQGNHP